MTKKRKELLSEDFLSDMETKSVSAEDVAGAPENVADDDFADLLGGLSSKQTAQPNAAHNEFEETVSTLKDAVNGLAVTVKEIKDAMAKQAEPAPAAEPAAPAEPEASPDVPPNVDLDSTPAPAPEGEAEKTEPAPEDKPVEDKPSEGEDGSAEAEEENSQDEFRKEDATKSEAYQLNRKAGKLLNSNSGSIIGIVESGKLYKLDEMIMTAVKAKIREKINEAKANLKAEFLKEAAEMPKAEPEMIVEEKKEEEEPKVEKKTMSFLEKLKAAKACKGSECSEDKCDESKKCSDKSSDPEEYKDGKKKDH